MATLFEAYVTNAGKYSEGQLVGETLKFPTTAQEVEALLKRIGVDGVRYQEIFITSFDGDVLGLYGVGIFVVGDSGGICGVGLICGSVSKGDSNDALAGVDERAAAVGRGDVGVIIGVAQPNRLGVQ